MQNTNALRCQKNCHLEYLEKTRKKVKREREHLGNQILFNFHVAELKIKICVSKISCGLAENERMTDECCRTEKHIKKTNLFADKWVNTQNWDAN